VAGMKAMNPQIVLPGIDKDHVMGHIDHNNPNSFEIDDLAKLIKKVTKKHIDNKILVLNRCIVLQYLRHGWRVLYSFMFGKDMVELAFGLTQLLRSHQP